MLIFDTSWGYSLNKKEKALIFVPSPFFIILIIFVKIIPGAELIFYMLQLKLKATAA
jgi:hypothetical protein